MAASNYHGKTAAAYINVNGAGLAAFTKLKGWSVTLTCSTADSTAMHATNTGRTALAGIPGGTATVECYFDETALTDCTEANNNDATQLAIELLRNTALNADKGYSGSVFCTGVSVGVDLGGTNVITYNFTFDSTISSTVTSGTV